MITFVTCTQETDSDFWKNTPLGKSLEKITFDYTPFIFSENKKGLSECYNIAIEKFINQDEKDNYLIFLHDDIFLLDLFFKEKIIESFARFDVLGIAGATKIDFKLGLSNYNKIAWHICCPREDWSGGCFHPVNNGDDDTMTNSYFTSFGRYNKKCATIDGLFIGVNLNKIKDIRFDENFKWDFYDMDFCLSCYKAGVSIGTTPIALHHCSHGAGLLEERYNETQTKFLEKWSVKK